MSLPLNYLPYFYPLFKLSYWKLLEAKPRAERHASFSCSWYLAALEFNICPKSRNTFLLSLLQLSIHNYSKKVYHAIFSLEHLRPTVIWRSDGKMKFRPFTTFISIWECFFIALVYSNFFFDEIRTKWNKTERKNMFVKPVVQRK